MGLLDNLSRKAEAIGTQRVKNATEYTSEKAASILKQLSGGKINYTKKVVDNLIVMMDASGGAGASTITANVAYLASRKNLRVLVIDLNLLLPTQQIYFNIKQEIKKPDLVDYLLGRISLGEAIDQTQLASVLYANNRGLMDCINCESDQALNNLKSALNGLRNLYDLIIIDCPTKVENALCNYAMYMADTIYMIWDDGISSITNTDKIRRNMASSGIDAYTKMKVILNKRTNIHYSEFPFNKLNVELVQYIPFEPDVIGASLNSQIFCKDGASRSKNAGYFISCLDALTSKMLEIGGYVE